jgi:pilus assembly protein Flp/PilA
MGETEMSKMITAFAKDESGATAIEYGLIAALVAVGLIAALTALGKSLSAIFTHVSTTLNTASS